MSDQSDFVDVGQEGSFIGHVGGLKRRRTAEGVETSLLVAPQHLNPNGTTHGGVLMTMLDITLGMNVEAFLKSEASGRHPITVQLNCNMMLAAPKGALVIGQAQVDGSSKTMTWVSGKLVAGGRVLMTGTAVFRNPPLPTPA
ncbi:PaaI family thioesterase [Sphingobium amiense]|uniref:PaaI family thioesterase n=1 Tax=Sphingobium amiense TaxID=135719 RepID=A0A494WFR0_9SPHN|nr:PaaI family thioesterase [Sphingobium amiense]BBD99880.1 PaaI family thioesterase [Sphingobium amiense]